MGIRVTVVLLLVASAGAVHAQTVEITPVAGRRFGGGNVNTNAQGDFQPGANFELDDTAAFGIHLAHPIGAGEIELLYARQGTELQSEDPLYAGVPAFALAVETWQLGGNYLFRDGARVRPYVGGGLGLTRLLPEPSGLSDETHFSVSLAAGARLGLGSHFGLRLEARGFFAFFGGDSGSYCATRPCGIGTSQLMSQVDLRAGATIGF